MSEFKKPTPELLQGIYLNSPDHIKKTRSMISYFNIFIDAKFPYEVVSKWFQEYAEMNIFATDIEGETIVIDPS